MIFGPLWTIGLVVLLVVLIVWFVRALGGASGPRQSSARAVLDERYAKGEIDREEYLRRRHDIDDV